MKKVLSLILVLSMVLTLAACGGSGSTETAESTTEGETAAAADDGDKVLNLAVCIPLTGDSAKAGQEFKDACDLALQQVDYQAGGYTINPTFVDVTIDPEKGALALEQAVVQNGIDVIILNWNSSVAIALMDVAVKYQIPYYFGLGAADTIVEKWADDPETYSYYIGKGWPNSAKLSVAYYDFIKEMEDAGTFTPRNKKVGLLCDDTDFGRSIGETLRNAFTEGGWEVAVEDYVATSVTDMYAPVSKMKEQDCSVVVGSFTNPASNAGYLKQADELGINAFKFCDCFTEDGDWYTKAGEASNYACDSRPKFASAAAKEFEQLFIDTYNYQPSATAAGQVWDYTNYFLKVVEEVSNRNDGVVDSEKLYDFGCNVLMKGDFPYTEGILQDCITYDIDNPDCQIDPVVGAGYYTFPILQLIDGEMIAVWPESQKEADVIIPDYAK